MQNQEMTKLLQILTFSSLVIGYLFAALPSDLAWNIEVIHPFGYF